MAGSTERIVREATEEERQRHAQVRRDIEAEFPPLRPPREPSVRNRIAAAARKSRLAAGLTPEQLAARAGIPHAAIVRDLEGGRDVQLSEMEAVTSALGLTLEIVAAAGPS
jgi:hypothetical protein